MTRHQRRCSLWVALVLFLASFPAWGALTAHGILVWRLEKKQGVTDQEIDSISGFITAEVERYSGRKVISEADITTILKGEETRQRCTGESNSSCIAEVGNALGVPEAVSGDLGRVGEFWFLNLRRLNVRQAEVIKRSSRNVRGDINALIETIPGAVAELFGKEAPPPVAAAPVEKPKPETTLTLKPEPPKETTSPSLASQRDYPMNPYKKYGYVTFFTGAGLMALGGVATWQAKEAADDYHNAATAGAARDARSANNAWSGAAIAGYTLGGALMVTGIVLWALSPGDEAWWKEHQVSAGPAANGQGAVVMLGGRW